MDDDIGKAHEKRRQVQARFDAQFEEIKREVAGLVEKQAGKGLELKKITVADGRLTILGEAAEMPQALKVLELLPQIGKQWVIEWSFPVPRPLQDSKRVEFRAEGVCTAAAEQGAATTPKGKVTTDMDADIIMDPQFADRWRLLKKKGHLADLPSKAVIPLKLEGRMSGTSAFQFTAPREIVQPWLAGSLDDATRKHYEKVQPWPEKPGAFDYTYEGLGDCMIHIKTLDAETVEVRLWLETKGPKRKLIAPDEAVPPTPKTAAPKEISGVTDGGAQTNTAPVHFDEAEVLREIRQLAAKTGVTLNELKNGGGKASIIGLSADSEDARMFGDLLTQAGMRRGMSWHMSTPRKVPDRPVMMFMVLGFQLTAPVADARGAMPAAPGALPPVSNWETLQRLGKLAALPAEAAPDKIMRGEVMAGPMSSVAYAFTASRKAVHAWLTASLSARRLAAEEDELRELREAGPFKHEFWSQDLCCMRVECAGDKARVLISRRSTLFRIAPDGPQKPRPAGKLAPEYQQEGLTAAIPAAPRFDDALQTLRSTVSPEEEKRLPWFMLAPPIVIDLQTSDAGEYEKDEEEALLNGSPLKGRARQALLTRLPLTR